MSSTIPREGLSSLYHTYLVTTQLIGSNALRKEIHLFYKSHLLFEMHYRYLMQLVERMPRVCKVGIKAKESYFEESKI
jgi:hypothetical protein